MPRPSALAAARAFEASRQRPAVRLVELATRAAEEPPVTDRIPRRLPQPEYPVAEGGCRTCGHLERVHSSGYNGKRVPCKSLGCGCQKHRGRRLDWETWVVLAICLGALILATAALAMS